MSSSQSLLIADRIKTSQPVLGPGQLKSPPDWQQSVFASTSQKHFIKEQFLLQYYLPEVPVIWHNPIGLASVISQILKPITDYSFSACAYDYCRIKSIMRRRKSIICRKNSIFCRKKCTKPFTAKAAENVAEESHNAERGHHATFLPISGKGRSLRCRKRS